MLTIEHARNFSFRHDTRFTDQVAADTRLSTKSKCLGYVLASLGDGEPVSPTAAELVRYCGFGRWGTLIEARKELERCGYVSTVRASGRIVSYVLHVQGEVR